FDGDCVPPSYNLAAHIGVARRNRYVAGGAVMLSQQVSDRFTAASVARGDLERIGWWWFQIDKPRRLLVNRLPGIRSLLDRTVSRGKRRDGGAGFAHYGERVATRHS